MFWCLNIVVSVCVTVVSGFTVRDVATSGEQLIDKHGSWTVTTTKKQWNRKTWRLQEALQTSHNLIGSSFFAISIYKDEDNSSRNVIDIYQSGLTLKDNAHIYEETRGRELYLLNAMKVGQLLGGHNRTINAKMSQVFKLEKKLAKIFVTNEEMSETYMTLRQFQKLIGSWIDMEKYMEAIFGKGVVTSNDELIVTSPEYFKKLNKVIASIDMEVLANYIIWNLLISTKDHLSKTLSIANVIVMKNEEAMKELDRKRRCLDISSVMLPFVTSALYVDRHFSQETVVKVVTTLDDIEHQFISNLDQIIWLDRETKNNLKEKAEAMTNKVGYPDWILDPIKLDAKYKNLVIEDGDFFQNFLNSIEFYGNIEKKKVKQSPVRNMWPDFPHTVNAFYNKRENEVVVLAAILQEPIVSKDYPTSYMYGTLGAILAHEIVHAFDSTESLFDKDGNLKDNWTPHVAEEFDKRAQCFVDQYNNFTVYGHNISGLLTLKENIADNGGIKMAYRAYKSAIKPHDLPLPGLNLTNDQLYFVGASHFYCSEYSKKFALLRIHYDVHAHDHFRVLGTAANSKDFAETFNCPVNSPMNPEKKCELW